MFLLFLLFSGHTKISKMLEAFSVMKMSEGKFTSTLQKKLQDHSEHVDSASSVSSSGGTRKMSESLSSSTSSSSTALERQDSFVENDGIVHQSSAGHRDCRYSASFTEVLSVKDPWSECPPYECASAQPPPYSETPESYGIQVADDVVVDQPNAARQKRKPMAMLQKVRSSLRSVSPGAQGKGKKNKGEKRRLFGLRRASEEQSSKGKATNCDDSFETIV